MIVFIGSWGWYQTLVFALAFYVGVYDGVQTLLMAFTTAPPNVRCYVPGIDNVSIETSDYNLVFDLNISTKVFGVAEKDSGIVAYCSFCPLSNSTVSCENSSSRILCSEGFLYDKSEHLATLTSKFDMVCDRAWMREMLKSIWMLGVLGGCFTLGYVSDRYGRKTTFIIASLSSVTLSSTLPFWNNFYMLVTVQLITGFFSAGIFMTAFVIVMELCEGVPRTLAGIGLQAAFTLGYILDGLFSYYMTDWRHVQWVSAALGLVFISYIWLLPESIRWLMQKGKVDLASRTIERAMKMNKVKKSFEKAKLETANTSHQKESSGLGSLWKMFKQPRLACCSAIVALNWVSGSMAYYGLSWYTSDLPGNKYFNFFMSGIVELPAYVVAVVMFEYCGRKFSLSISFCAAGICCFISGTLSTEQVAAIVTVAMIGKSCIAAAYAMIYNYTAEFFPTECRNSGSGLCSMLARIGSIISPQIHLLGRYTVPWLPIVVFGTFCFAAGALDLFLPETKNKKLPDTVEDAVNFISGRSSLINESNVNEMENAYKVSKEEKGVFTKLNMLSKINADVEEKWMRRAALLAMIVATFSLTSVISVLITFFTAFQQINWHISNEIGLCNVKYTNLRLNTALFMHNLMHVRQKRHWSFGEWFPEDETNIYPPLTSENPKGLAQCFCTKARGPPGIPGGNGVNGKDGENGKSGRDGIPGQNGKILNSNTNVTYCQICLQGPMGPAGRIGVKGPLGPKGMPGPPGIDGVRGERGMVGTEGFQGRVGTCGVPGPKGKDGIVIHQMGPPGPPGCRGTKGVSGQPGIKGINGKPGAQGLTGDKGDQGEVGVPGKAGHQGPVGNRGQTGLPGSCEHCPIPRLAPGY